MATTRRLRGERLVTLSRTSCIAGWVVGVAKVSGLVRL